MKPSRFAYHAPAGLGEVRDLIERYGADAVPLAGGQSLVPLMAMRQVRPRALIDLNGVPELAGIRAEPDAVVIGAMTRQRAVERSLLVRSRLPLLAEAIAHIGHPQVRNRGTVGGSLALAHPGAELPAVALALDASLATMGPLLTSVRFRVPPAGAGYGFHETGRRARDFPTAGAAVVLAPAYARVALMGPVSMRAEAAESALLDGASLEDAAALAGELVADPDLRDMTVALSFRALADARRRLGDCP